MSTLENAKNITPLPVCDRASKACYHCGFDDGYAHGFRDAKAEGSLWLWVAVAVEAIALIWIALRAIL